jgi:hypothetical protein
LSRPRFLLALAALVAIGSLFAACGDGDGGNGGGDPQAVIDEATLQGVGSGVLDLSLAVDAPGKEGGELDVSLSGPFQGGGAKEDLPQLDLTTDVSGSFDDENIDFEGGLVLLPNSAYVNYRGTEYEVDPTTFSFVESALKQAQREAGAESTDVTACQEAAAKLRVRDFIGNLTEESDADVGGTSTTKVSGDLDVSGSIDALVDLVENPACSSQIGAAGALLSKSEIDDAKSEITDAVKTAHVDVYVGDDDIVRQISAQLDIEPEDSSKGGPQSIAIDFELKLTEVNEEQEIAAPDGAKPLSDLFIELGVNPIELLELLQGKGGAGGIAGLLEGFSGGTGGSGGGGGSQQSYLECLQNVRSAADLQKCARLR